MSARSLAMWARCLVAAAWSRCWCGPGLARSRRPRRATRALSAESIPGLLRPAVEAVAALPSVWLSAEQVAAIARGCSLSSRELAGAAVPGGEIALLGPDGALVAIAESEPELGRIHPRRVLATG